MNTMFLALGLFIVMYVLLLKFSDQRWIIALGFAALFLALRILTVYDALQAINWNVLLMLAGTMITVELFIESGMPARMAEQLLRLVPNVKWAIVVLSIFAGVISAFVDNVATVLMVAPIGLAVAKKLKINPVPVIISIAVASNLEGAATLVGDTTSILLGSYAGMSFNDFFFFEGKASIFFSTQAGMLATIPVLLYLFKENKESISSELTTTVKDYVPTVLMVGTIISLIVASQFPDKPELTNGVLCVGIGLLGVIYETINEKSTDVWKRAAGAIDFKTLLLLAGLFMVIQGITEAGVIDWIAELFVKIGGNSILLMYVMIVAISVLLSAFIDNIPYVATMLPVVEGIATKMALSSPVLFYFGLLIGATLGGNMTPVGASANIAGIGILKKNGYEVKTTDFMRIGVPFTLIAASVGAIVTWFIWA